jgi:FkbH-like protein
MNITQAIEILRLARNAPKTFEVKLACGFTPLHLQTFLAAHLQAQMLDRQVKVTPGLYGNMLQTVEEDAKSESTNLAITLEWPDLDARLGYRAFHQWTSKTLSDVLANSTATLGTLLGLVLKVAPTRKVVISTPTLPIAPIFQTTSLQLSEAEALLQREISEFEMKAVQAGASVVNGMKLAQLSPWNSRYDFKSDLLLGIPYSLGHADALASAIAQLMYTPAPKKGIITDLDDTLWAGLVGEEGINGVHWDLEHRAGLHACYQMLLASLSEFGVLVAVASKNERELVEKTFQRDDMLLRRDRIFPMEVHWNAKSGSVSGILNAWNIGAGDVVFVDDNPAELAEVAAAHPGVECVQFPTKDYGAGLEVLNRLRDLFGKPHITAEDGVRVESVRQAIQFREDKGATSEEFLRRANAVVRFDDQTSESGSRPLELVNKTNQFNLNGIRYTESEWRKELSTPDSVLLVADYRDRFGMLGKISVLAGHRDGECLRVGIWVMSCRAFGRRIEHLCLRTLFERYAINKIIFEVKRTERNGPLREFMTSLVGENEFVGNITLTREEFNLACPPLYHNVDDTRSVLQDASNEGPFS